MDGVANALISAPGVQKSVALLLNGKIHGFLQPDTCDMDAVRATLKSTLPYYAHPSEYHLLETFPLTFNGKVDKTALTEMVAREEQLALMPTTPLTTSTAVSEEVSAPLDLEKQLSVSISPQPSCGSLTSGTNSTTSLGTSLDLKPEHSEIRFDLERAVPEKQWPKYLRNLVKIVLIPYRFLLSTVYIFNIAALISMYIYGFNRNWTGNMVAINLNIAVLIRQDFVINALYTICCSVPKSWPLWIRTSAAKIYHLGGIHASAATWASLWLLAGNITDAVCLARHDMCIDYPLRSAPYQALSWIISAFFVTMIVFAWPTFRTGNHNFFERWHRFMGWTMLALFWAQAFVAIHDTATDMSISYRKALVSSPSFWLLISATLSIASSWFWLRRVPVVSEVLSDHAIRLHFDYVVPVNGSFARLSFRPLVEWHSFATIPAPEPHGRDGMYPKGYSLVVSNAGDWTRHCIQNPPTHLWVRSVPTCGVMRIATLFNRVVVVATGSGIGPCLGHIQAPSCPTAVLWSTREPEKSFGQGIVDAVRKEVSHAVIWDTKVQGRPDMVRLAYNMAKDFRAEAVIIIANQKITKKVVYGLETRGVPCYGAIWDS